MAKTRKIVTIYTDGACSGNPGPGGWGVVLLYGNHRKELSGAEPETTNNRMELTAVISGLQALKEPCHAEIYTDSAYVHNAFANGWLDKWLRNGWKTSAKKDVINQDLWQQLQSLRNMHEVVFHKVKGHADNELNNRCDQLARESISSLKTV